MSELTDQDWNRERMSYVYTALLDAAHTDRDAAEEKARPSMLLRPLLSIDGNQWCALYGDNLQDGVAGFGTSPAKAFRAFDKNWLADLAEGKEPQEGGA